VGVSPTGRMNKEWVGHRPTLREVDMPNYRRASFPGGYYFFTVVTHQRRRFLTDEVARECLRRAWDKMQETHPFEAVALCLLPDHLHCVWKLPDGDAAFSSRWAGIKGLFSRYYLAAGGRGGQANTSRQRHREQPLWQRRFWEHQIRENDLQRHVDYIHYNPVKHRMVADAGDWPWSTYHRYVRRGFYPTCWVPEVAGPMKEEPDYGE
jgi:putative transposase